MTQTKYTPEQIEKIKKSYIPCGNCGATGYYFDRFDYEKPVKKPCKRCNCTGKLYDGVEMSDALAEIERLTLEFYGDRVMEPKIINEFNISSIITLANEGINIINKITLSH